MLQNFVVKNFRCLGGLRLHLLARVNLIAGKNNTGKTALLEAIRLHCNPGNCQLPIDVNKERGVEDPVGAQADVCGWLFFDKDPASAIELSSEDGRGDVHTLTVQLVDAVTSREAFPDVEELLSHHFRDGAQASPRLILRYRGPRDETRTSVGFFTGSGFTFIGARIPWGVRTAFINSGTPGSSKDLEYFGELEAAKRQGEVLPALQIIEPRLQRLTLVPFVGQTVIHGDVGLSRLIPVPFLGEGLKRLLSVVLAIANTRDGIVLIDEIENGLHYSVLVQAW